jgi:protein required for attachment to host cells
MILPANAHVAVVDGERFLLMRNRGTLVEPKLQLEAEPEVSEHNKSAGMRHQEDVRMRKVEPLDKFAHAAGVAEWLNHAVLTHRIDKLLVVADPDTLGEMRKHYHKVTEAALIGELDKQVTGMPGTDILKVIEAA